jgi:hypothetical protein
VLLRAMDPDVSDVKTAVERLREVVARYRVRLQEARDRIAALDRLTRLTRRHCPHCAGTSFKTIPGMIEGAECLTCGMVFVSNRLSVTGDKS